MTPWVNTCMRRAPVSDSASTGAMSICSIVSAKSRPSMPIECTESASAPGNGPRPDGGNEEQRPDEIGHRAGETDDAARDDNRATATA